MTLSIECRYAERRYAEYDNYLNVMVSIILLNVIMLKVVILNVVATKIERFFAIIKYREMLSGYVKIS